MTRTQRLRAYLRARGDAMMICATLALLVGALVLALGRSLEWW